MYLVMFRSAIHPLTPFCHFPFVAIHQDDQGPSKRMRSMLQARHNTLLNPRSQAVTTLNEEEEEEEEESRG